jgi:putative CocE/NonD family hydrolase
MNVPSYIIASWFDFMSRGSIDSYVGRNNKGGPQARGKQWLRIGPWLHGGQKTNTKVAEMQFPDNAAFDLDAHMVRWFDHHLKGVSNGVEKEPRVRYYNMGGNEWRDAPDWPVPSKATSYYLLPEGGLGLTAAASGTTEYVADPLHPAPARGRTEPTARDAREFEAHSDVRSFSSEVLRTPVEWTGDVRAEIFLSSSAPDTDVFVRINDVYPDGRSMLLLDSVQRAKYRDSFERPSLLKAGEVYRIALTVGALSHTFLAGHRIRVVVSGSAADYFEVNPNTGEVPTYDGPKRFLVARNVIHHAGARASRVIAPVR